LLAASAVHVVTTAILLDLAEAVRAQPNKVRLILSPVLVPLSIDHLKANTTLLSHDTSSKLLLATVRVHAEAIVLNEVAATEGARSKFAIDLEFGKSLVKSEPIELIPGMLINERLDLLVVNNLNAGEVRALNSNEVVDGHNEGNVLPRYSGDLVVKARSLINLYADVGRDTSRAEAMATVKLGRITIEFSETNAAFILGATRRSQKSEVEGSSR